MTLLCGWVPAGPENGTDRVVGVIGRALRVHSRQVWAQWDLPNCSIGLLEIPTDSQGACYDPAISHDGRFHLWMAGEVFAGRGLPEASVGAFARSVDFRKVLLAAFLERGERAIQDLDGEYQIVVWDSRDRVLTILNDRFGGLPLYWARSSRGFAFGGGVRGVLAAPGVSADPDADALREAVTFGGFRLGDRTNVAAVKMVPGACVVTVRDGSPKFRRYWRWTDVRPLDERPMRELVEEAHGLWQQAVRRRLDGAKSAGQTLSGGLDSRAILAEAAPRVSAWVSVSYGIPRCDDVVYAQSAAHAVGATWVFYPLYSGRDPDWLERRTRWIQHTDGLIELGDLLHLEALPLAAGLVDVNLSGYIGDAVTGPTFDVVSTGRDILMQLPFYGCGIGLDWDQALGRVEECIAALDGAAPRFALFEHKVPQSTNRWCAAYRPWVRLRKPFVDYSFFDFCQGLPHAMRVSGAFRETWLLSRYPGCFGRIPNQKTGMVVATPRWRVQVERGRRLIWRMIQPALVRVGLPARPRIRQYRADEVFWRTRDARARIEETILRPASLCCDILGRESVTRIVADWFEKAAAPVQVIGALYVYEAYHRDLDAHLRAPSYQ